MYSLTSILSQRITLDNAYVSDEGVNLRGGGCFYLYVDYDDV